MARSSAMTIPEVTVNRVSLDAPWQWLAAGWRDVLAAPHIGLVIGGVLAAVVLHNGGAVCLRLGSADPAIMRRFFVGGSHSSGALYETSRRLERTAASTDGSARLRQVCA